MNKFALGAVAGASSLAVAVPLLAQMSFAASDDPAEILADRPAPTKECILAMAEQENHFLTNVDAMIAAHKSAAGTHRDALIAAADITDDAARKEALKTAHEAFAEAMKAAHEAQGNHAEQMDAMRDACGDNMMFIHKMGMGPMMGPGKMGNVFMMKLHGGPRMDAFLEKLGMTEEELKAELQGGKTIHDIAEEKGIELPDPGKRIRHMEWRPDEDDDVKDQTESNVQ